MPELILRLADDGQLTLTTDLDPPVPLTGWPIADADPEPLRWLLEDCPAHPIGPDRRRYQEAARRVREYGTTLAELVTSTPEAQDVITRLVAAPAEWFVRIESSHQGFLAIPWELLVIGGGYPFAAVGGLIRSAGGRGDRVSARAVGDAGRIRVLMASPRPYGTDDVRARTVRGPMLQAAVDSAGAIQISLLRPATFANLAENLTHRDRYDVLHIDGHGYLSDQGSGLVFERDDGRAARIPAEKFAAAVPTDDDLIVILNACRSAAQSPDADLRSVTAALRSRGVVAVLGMTHNVPATVVSRFMTEFYAQLARGETVVAATTAGRSALLADAITDGDHDRFPLPFFAIAVLYADDMTVAPPASRRSETTPTSAEIGAERLDMLMYRDRDLAALDRMLLRPEPVAVFACAGMGKTTFLNAYARYCDLTGAYDAIIHATGPDVSEPIVDSDRRILHVWDDVDDHWVAVAAALRRLSPTHRVLLVARSIPAGLPFQRYLLPPLPPEIVSDRLRDIVFAHELQFNQPLMSWLILSTGHHGRSLDVVAAAATSMGIREVARELTVGTSGAPELLDHTIVRQLRAATERTIRYLPLLGLCGQFVLPRVLSLVTNRGLVEDAFADITGERVDFDQWNEMLGEAERLGLVTMIGPDAEAGFYIPPVVGYALRDVLARTWSSDEIAALSRAVGVAANGVLHHHADGITDETAYTLSRTQRFVVDMLESCTYASIWFALHHGDFAFAGGLARAYSVEPAGSAGWSRTTRMLGDIYQLADEDRSRDGAAAFFASVEIILATAALIQSEYATATVYLRRALDNRDQIIVQSHLGFLLRETAVVGAHSGNLAEATTFLAEAVAHATADNNPAALSDCAYTCSEVCRLLGITGPDASAFAVSVGLPDAAVDPEGDITWSRQSDDDLAALLRVADVREDLESRVNIRRYLGKRARERGAYTEAAAWLTAAIAIGAGQLGPRHLVSTAHELSMLEEERDNLDDAAGWCDFVIETLTDLGEPDVLLAHAYHERGIIELKRERPAEATAALTTAADFYRSHGLTAYAADSEILLAYVAFGAGDAASAVHHMAALVDGPAPLPLPPAQMIRALILLVESRQAAGLDGDVSRYLDAARSLVQSIPAAEREGFIAMIATLVAGE